MNIFYSAPCEKNVHELVFVVVVVVAGGLARALDRLLLFCCRSTACFLDQPAVSYSTTSRRFLGLAPSGAPFLIIATNSL